MYVFHYHVYSTECVAAVARRHYIHPYTVAMTTVTITIYHLVRIANTLLYTVVVCRGVTRDVCIGLCMVVVI